MKTCSAGIKIKVHNLLQKYCPFRAFFIVPYRNGALIEVAQVQPWSVCWPSLAPSWRDHLHIHLSCQHYNVIFSGHGEKNEKKNIMYTGNSWIKPTNECKSIICQRQNCQNNVLMTLSLNLGWLQISSVVMPTSLRECFPASNSAHQHAEKITPTMDVWNKVFW